MNPSEYDTMKIMPLGGGQEVGRSCIHLEFKGRSILLDCGSHPGIDGNGSLPFFDSLDDPSTIDMILITHFHIDHVAALPYFTEKTDFRGRIFMTHATKAVMKLLLSDNIKLQVRSKSLYSEQDLEKCVDKIEVLDFYQTIEYKGVKVTASKAGHVLGACMYTIDIDGVRVLYTGDYSMEEDRHLPQADIPSGPSPDVLIVESTFGTTNLSSREERETMFVRTVEQIVLTNRGSCLIPVFALGRAQELLLLLDDLWQRNSKLSATVPIYYASKLANKALKIYETFVNMMSGNVQQLLDIQGNPFTLRNITRVAANSDIDHAMGLSSSIAFGGSAGGSGSGNTPCVVVASPGFLQSGVSRYLFERWCDDARNGVIMAGYTVEGTLAHQLLNAPKEITCLDNRKKQVKCSISNISFSAHVDFTGNLKFIKTVNPGHIVLVHGEKTQMLRLKSRLDEEIKQPTWGISLTSTHTANSIPIANTGRKPKVVTPQNGQAVQLRFPKRLSAEIVGTVATEILKSLSSSNTSIMDNSSNGKTGIAPIPSGAVLITENFTSKVVSRDELKTYSSYRGLSIKQHQMIPIPSDIIHILLPTNSNLFTHSSSMTINGINSMDEILLQFVLPYIEDLFDDVLFVPISSEAENNDHTPYILVQKLIRVSIMKVISMKGENSLGDRKPTKKSNRMQHKSENKLSDDNISQDNIMYENVNLSVEWGGNPMEDMLADALIGALIQSVAAAFVLRTMSCRPISTVSSTNDKNYAMKRKAPIDKKSYSSMKSNI